MASNIWYVYMLECQGGRIYTGITPDVDARFKKHRNGSGALFTRINKPVRLLAAMPCDSRGQAARLESTLKKFERNNKLLWAADWTWDRQKIG